MVNVRAFAHAPEEKLMLISLVASIATSDDELVQHNTGSAESRLRAIHSSPVFSSHSQN
jgi:hypothetical protein